MYVSSVRSRIEGSPIFGMENATPGTSTGESGDNHNDPLKNVDPVIELPKTVRSLVLPCMMDESIVNPKIATLRSNNEDGYNLAISEEITISNSKEVPDTSDENPHPIWTNVKVKLLLRRKAASHSKENPGTPLVSDHNYSKMWPNKENFKTYNSVKFLFMKHLLEKNPGAMEALYPDASSDGKCSYEYLKNFPFRESQTVASDQSESVMDTEDSSGSLEVKGKTLNPEEAEKNRLWSQAVEIIHTERLHRLILDDKINKYALKRGLTEHSAKKFSNLFESAKKIGSSKWLHENLLKHFNIVYRSIYLKTLDFIYNSNPELVSPFYTPSPSPSPTPTPSVGDKKPKAVSEDPIYLHTLKYYPMKKLPKQPIIILVPNRDCDEPITPRMKYWIKLFQSMGKLITFSRTSVLECRNSEDMCLMVARKILKCRIELANKPIVLIGFGQAAMIAFFCTLAYPSNIAALVCLGFQMDENSFNEPVISKLTNLAVPTQIIIGENSKKISLKHIQDFTSKLRVEYNLVIVGDADDKLEIVSDKLNAEGLTQIMADRCIADEIYDYCALALTYHLKIFKSTLQEFRVPPEVLFNLDAPVYHKPEPNQPPEYNVKPANVRRLTEEDDPELYEKRRREQLATMMVMSGGKNSMLAEHLRRQRLSDVYPNSGLSEEQLQERELARAMEKGRQAIRDAFNVWVCELDSDSDSDSDSD